MPPLQPLALHPHSRWPGGAVSGGSAFPNAYVSSLSLAPDPTGASAYYYSENKDTDYTDVRIHTDKICENLSGALTPSYTIEELREDLTALAMA